MGSPVDDALGRLDACIVKLSGYEQGPEPWLSPQGQADLATVRQRLAEQDAELERLREELLFTARRPDDQEKIDAWWRARSEVKVDGNSRAEYVLQRDAAWERAEAAEAEVRQLREAQASLLAEQVRLTEGLRPFVEDFDFHAADYLADRVDGEEARVFTARTVDLLIEHQRNARALLAGSEAEPVRREVKVDPAMFGESNRLLGEPDGGGAK